MHPSMRLLKPDLASAHAGRRLHVCLTCRNDPPSRPLLATQIRNNSSSSGSTSLTERWRRRLWGTDKPPGPKDPYGGQGVLERKWRRQNEPSEVPSEAQTAEPEEGDIAPPEDYVQATTVEGLERVGHTGGWRHAGRSRSDSYIGPYGNGSMGRDVRVGLKHKGQLELVAHQAAVEIALLQRTRKPMEKLYRLGRHKPEVFNMIRDCKLKHGSKHWGDAITFPDETVQKNLTRKFEKLKPADFGRAKQSGIPREFHGHMEPADQGFKSLSLADHATRFAFGKRFTQLTGQRFPDFIPQSAPTTPPGPPTVGDAIECVKGMANPPHAKLASRLKNPGTAHLLPNVKIGKKRQTLDDEDEELGRKKLIEAEFAARGLLEPVKLRPWERARAST